MHFRSVFTDLIWSRLEDKGLRGILTNLSSFSKKNIYIFFDHVRQPVLVVFGKPIFTNLEQMSIDICFHYGSAK